MDFTLAKYKEICKALKKSNYTFLTFDSYFDLLADNALPEKYVLLRHDVDRQNINSLKMSEEESSLGIVSTYYFRDRKCSFDKNIMNKMISLNHEVGYHYETLADCKGNYEDAISLYVKNIKRFEEINPVTTICMHGSPLSGIDNRDLWQKYNLKDYSIKGEPYLSIDYSTVLYFTDTGRCWDGFKTNLRDFVDNGDLKPKENIHTSDDLIKFIKSYDKPIIIQTHPERWAYNNITFIYSLFMDSLTNTIKYILKKIR